uniref:Uncharacterized protein n=1 Tax=Grammatophora oceanica TaxID=210454 RepID=A0A7S1VLR0_9STRA|mmetsp:Transcript_48442/g.72250  ORF Transcript_48442/g.72250 Transcript_48442/m.72250 type:complete len:414 (+) Transcript_48442:69-1310(+)|eukprot:CAMPEP_0194033612 /NCGR_PEP_ID=MMETSP0009_2-20130614/6234_1 /TAXON_ID=210454 /ORGANISM="Grammatophora oceanica, Strain CCMP 410" /LENGTH=413 /DNA_ID=CAMNT_0038674327 /DNA_START=46 /DNA_END=1287 /DNA_ORIENTATION=-
MTTFATVFVCWFLLAVTPFFGSARLEWINEDPSFVESSSTDNPGGAVHWNLQEIKPLSRSESLSVSPIQFLRDPEVDGKETQGYCLMTLWEGATFPPAYIRLGQSVKLLKDYLYSVVVWARVHRGTTIYGKEGAIVSTFCQDLSGGGFIGKDTTLNAVNTTSRTGYSRIQFYVVGNGDNWDCYIGLLGQLTSDNPAKEVEMYVDDFRIWEVKEMSSPGVTNDALADGEFDERLSMIQYLDDGKPQFTGDTPWHLDYNRYYMEGSIPYIQDGRLHMHLAANRSFGEFLGVFQQVSLSQGQKYRLSVDYVREIPTVLPPDVSVSIFNFYVRLPDAEGPIQPHVEWTEGLLLGEVDVRLERNNGPNGTSSMTFVAPQSTIYEVVLKMSAYGNPGLGEYEMSFDNAQLMPVNNPIND